MQKKLANAGVTDVEDAGAVADISRAPTTRGSAHWQPTARRSTRAIQQNWLYRLAHDVANLLTATSLPYPSLCRACARRGREGASAGSSVRVRSPVTALGRRDSRPARPGHRPAQRPPGIVPQIDQLIQPDRNCLSSGAPRSRPPGAVAGRCKYSVAFTSSSVRARARPRLVRMDGCHGLARVAGNKRAHAGEGRRTPRGANPERAAGLQRPGRRLRDESSCSRRARR